MPDISKSFFARTYVRTLRFCKPELSRSVEPHYDSDHLSHNSRLFRSFPGLLQTAGERVRLHNQQGPALLKPSASIAVAHGNKIDWPVVFTRPVIIGEFPERCVH